VLDRSTAHGQATLGSRRLRLPQDLQVDCGVEILPDQIAPFLGIELWRYSSRIHQIAEHQRNVPTLAGGYNKTIARVGTAPPNHFLIVQWPNKEAADKSWTENVQKWWDSSGSKYASDFRDIGVEGIEQK
jgi:hypothetical protein